ncbi:DUF4932 domain-containing protein [Gramella sp. BOM4]|nr:DUF4932 domain-containing protein [Christiangramia bathymodioli]
MKKIIILFLCLYGSTIIGQESGNVSKPIVDKRIELLSIAFRLAESPEYSSEVFSLYTNRIEAYYSEFKDHELIEFIKKIRQKDGVGYDAVMKMAVHLDEDLNPRIEFNEKIPEVRWGRKNAYEFVGLLKDFYHETRTKEFFENNEELYAEASERFLPVYEMLDEKWYTDFYGNEPREKFIIINGLGNGGGNFGASVELPGGKKEIYAIMGTWNTDAEGMVKFPVEAYFSTLLHEFNHSFVNELLKNKEESFRESAEIIFEVVKEEMKNGAYGSWQTMINEALVRAAVIKYMKDHSFPEDQISLEISEQRNRGFIWIEDLVSELEFYDKHRAQFSTLEDYFPKLAEAYGNYAVNIQKYVEEERQSQAKFVSITEFENGSENVNPNLKQISLNFDKPFRGANFIRPGNERRFPTFTNLRYSEDRKTVILDWELEEDMEYEFFLIGISSKTESSPVSEDFPIRFSTR